MTAKMPIEKKKVMTPEFRAAFSYVFIKRPNKEDPKQEKYSIAMIFSKKVSIKELHQAAINAGLEKWGTVDRTKWPKGHYWPFKNGDEYQDTKGYAGNIIVNATSKTQPQVIGNVRGEDNRFPRLETEAEFYSGCYARATLIANAWEQHGKKGVSFNLQNVQKLRDGEKFSGRRDAEEEFDEVTDVDSDDASNYQETSEVDVGF